MTDLVSIIIPTYNRPDFLRRSIDSCLKQTYNNIEILVIDDNDPQSVSRLETNLLINKYYSQTTNLRYIKRDYNGGGSEARNTGIKTANGKYIAFLDDDDEFGEKYIENQYKSVLEHNTEISISNYIKIKDGESKIITKDISGYVFNRDAIRYFMFYGFSYTSTLFSSKRILEKVNGFTNSVSGQETLLIAKILQTGINFYVSSFYDVFIYSQGQQQISTSKNRIKGIKQSHRERKKLIKYLEKPERIKILVGNQLVYLREYIRTKQWVFIIRPFFLIIINYLHLFFLYPKKATDFLKDFINRRY
jgi:glycosyltransferase involved in cell wall biosynthesis